MGENEIQFAIQKLRNRKTVGPDEITDGIIKINEEWLSPTLKQLRNTCRDKNAMPRGWLEVITPSYIKNETGDHNNYRPITLINVIYNLRATIMSNRLRPLLNLITQDSQYTYKKQKSTIDALALINTSKN